MNELNLQNKSVHKIFERPKGKAYREIKFKGFTPDAEPVKRNKKK